MYFAVLLILKLWIKEAVEIIRQGPNFDILCYSINPFVLRFRRTKAKKAFISCRHVILSD